MNEISREMPMLSMTESILAEDVRDGCHDKCHCPEECCEQNDHEFQSEIDRTVKCFWELRRFAHEVCKCLKCAPSGGRLLTIYTCLILEDINSVFKKVVDCKKPICCKQHREADLILPNENFCSNITSGTIFVTNGQTEKVRIAVLNNSAGPQTVRVRILDSSVNSPAVLGDELLEVSSGSTRFISQPLGSAAIYEIQVFQLVPGMSVSAVEEASSGSFIDGTKLPAMAFIPNLGIFP